MNKTLEERKNEAYAEGQKAGWAKREQQVQELRKELEKKQQQLTNGVPAELAAERKQVARLQEQLRQLTPNGELPQE